MSVAEPEEWGPEGLCEQFWDVDRKMHNRRFAFILGAGASVQSGIPAAGALVWRWLTELHRRIDRGGLPLERWATAQALEIADFSVAHAPAFYSQVFARRFRQHPDEGYADLEDIMQGKDPSFGYSVLAHILAATRHKLVITTNFDNLVSDALSIFTGTTPLVCGHESLANFVHVEPRRPLVVKIHRDLLMAPMNRVAEIAALQGAWVDPLTRVFSRYTPIVIGYGGNDGSLMGFLNNLPEDAIPGGIFWCYYGPGGRPGPEIRHLVARHRGILVPIEGFDELMLRLSAQMRIPLLDQVIESKARARVDNYRRRVEELQARLFPPPLAEVAPEVEAEPEPEAAERRRAAPPPVPPDRSPEPPPPVPEAISSERPLARRDGSPLGSSEPRPVTRGPALQPVPSAIPTPAPARQSATSASEPAPRQPGPAPGPSEARPAAPQQHVSSTSAEPRRGLESARTRPPPAAVPADRSLPVSEPDAGLREAAPNPPSDASPPPPAAEVAADSLLSFGADAITQLAAADEHTPTGGPTADAVSPVETAPRGSITDPEVGVVTSGSFIGSPVATAPRGWSTGPLVRVPVRDAPLQRALLQLTGDAVHSPWTTWMQSRAEPNRERALDLLRAALLEFPDNDLLLLGVAERVADPPTLETVTLAVQAISNVLRHNKDHEVALWHLVLLLAWQGDYPRAIDVLERATLLAAADAANSAVVAFLWGLLARLQDLDDERALAQFKRWSEGLALRLHPPRVLVFALTNRLDPASQRLYTHLFQRLAGTLSEAELTASEPRFAAIEPTPPDTFHLG